MSGRPVPRFRGSAIEVDKHWSWELLVCIGELDPLVMGPPKAHPVFLSKEAALADMRGHLPGIAKEVCAAMGLPEPTAFNDLNKNTMVDMKDWSTDGRRST